MESVTVERLRQSILDGVEFKSIAHQLVLKVRSILEQSETWVPASQLGEMLGRGKHYINDLLRGVKDLLGLVSSPMGWTCEENDSVHQVGTHQTGSKQVGTHLSIVADEVDHDAQDMEAATEEAEQWGDQKRVALEREIEDAVNYARVSLVGTDLEMELQAILEMYEDQFEKLEARIENKKQQLYVTRVSERKSRERLAVQGF